MKPSEFNMIVTEATSANEVAMEGLFNSMTPEDRAACKKIREALQAKYTEAAAKIGELAEKHMAGRPKGEARNQALLNYTRDVRPVCDQINKEADKAEKELNDISGSSVQKKLAMMVVRNVRKDFKIVDRKI